MTLLDKPQHVPTAPSVVSDVTREINSFEPQRHRWTPEDVYKMLDAGILHEGRGCELIDGELIDMSPQNDPHAFAVTRCARLLLAVFDEKWTVTIQGTVRLPRGDMPEPDLAIREGAPNPNSDVHPLPVLAIEISDTTLLYDQTNKASLYAANGIVDYWVVNLIDRQVEVYRNPVPDPSRRHGFRYSTVNTFAPGTKVSPLAAPHVSLEIDRLLS